ncbi:TRAM domain-containing protein [Halococcus sp. PRR34]|uniref:TRAM domain-containing protein n=1 Tax=Halococcus sp. PRR34 TaxID=3020830 RepID=UPI00235F160F|nr:TRAM domain-containing protein [Halococcus sp. PRR34]
MVEIPDQLECLFSGSIDQQGDAYRIEIPRSELEDGTITNGETYRVAVLSSTPQYDDAEARQQSSGTPSDADGSDRQSPPVEPGDIRDVTIESLGDQGDGIAKIDRGYVVIVPGTRPDEEVTIEIEQAKENVAFARVCDDSSDSTDSGTDDFDGSFAEETLGESE